MTQDELNYWGGKTNNISKWEHCKIFWKILIGLVIMVIISDSGPD